MKVKHIMINLGFHLFPLRHAPICHLWLAWNSRAVAQICKTRTQKTTVLTSCAGDFEFYPSLISMVVENLSQVLQSRTNKVKHVLQSPRNIFPLSSVPPK